jgi:hypothetical protein
MMVLTSKNKLSGNGDKFYWKFSNKRCLVRSLVHHLADITQTSSIFRIFDGAGASARFLFRCDFFQDGGSAVFHIIVFNLFLRIIKAMANQHVILEFMVINSGNLHADISLRISAEFIYKASSSY